MLKKYLPKMDARCNAHPLGFRGEDGTFLGFDETCTHRKCADCVLDSEYYLDSQHVKRAKPIRDGALIQLLKIEP